VLKTRMMASAAVHSPKLMETASTLYKQQGKFPSPMRRSSLFVLSLMPPPSSLLSPFPLPQGSEASTAVSTPTSCARWSSTAPRWRATTRSRP
jgi:hypothetical protein